VVIFAKPDDPNDWAEKILYALSLPADTKFNLIDAAYKLANRFSWEGRANAILEFLQLI
jgi:glycosyltransferase involved in cell wall biosynthesis